MRTSQFSLSPLDAIAIRLFEAFDVTIVSETNEKRIYLFNGHDLERWLLKVLCGIVNSKSLTIDEAIDMSIPRKWLDVLLGQNELEDGQGLYICNDIGHESKGPIGIELRAITNEQRLTGLGVSVCGQELILSMTGFPSRLFDSRRFVYRPFEIYTKKNVFEQSIVFSWDGTADKGTITLTLQ